MTSIEHVKRLFEKPITRLFTFSSTLAEKFSMKPVSCNLPLEDQMRLNIGGHWWLDVSTSEVEEFFVEKVVDFGKTYFVPHAVRWQGHWFMAPRAPRYWFPGNVFYSVSRFGIARQYSKLDAQLVLKATYSRR